MTLRWECCLPHRAWERLAVIVAAEFAALLEDLDDGAGPGLHALTMAMRSSW